MTEKRLDEIVHETIENFINESEPQTLNKHIASLIKEDFRKRHRPAKNLNEDVMNRYYNVHRSLDVASAPVLIEGITVDRLMKKHGNNGFVIISANLSEMDDEYNTQATKSLISDLKLSGYSYLPTYGGYHNSDSSEDDVYEPSFIVFNYFSNGELSNFEDLRNFAIEMCGKYEQDSVFIQEPGKAPNYVDVNGEIMNTSSSTDYIKNDMNQECFTSLSSPEHLAARDRNGESKGRRFTSDVIFENLNQSRLYVNPMPYQLSERMRRKGEVMIWC